MLDSIRNGDVEDLPDSSQILTYLDLFTVVALQSAPTAISSQALPQRFIFRNGDFVSTSAALTNPNVIQMFNVVNIAINNPPAVTGPLIQFEPNSPRYHWQLPIDPQIILAMIISRFNDTVQDWEEILLIEQIHIQLLTRANLLAARGRGGRGGRIGRGRGGDGDGGNRGRGRGRGGRGRGLGNGDGGREAKSRPKKSKPKNNCWEWGLDDEFDLKILSEEVEQASDQSREQFSDLTSPFCNNFA